MMRQLQRLSLSISAVGALALVAGALAREASIWQPAVVVVGFGLAFGLGGIPHLRTYQFTAWIVAAVAAAMVYPAPFLNLGPLELRSKSLILLIMQLVMFGMGTQMKLRDFAGVVRMPYPVLIGATLQFTVMPLVGFSLARALSFSPEVAAGIVLVGSCSSGLASNVMTYIAVANLPLSITLTSITTLLAPIATPMWMKLLAGRMIEVNFSAMMTEIIKLIIVPIVAAMLGDYLESAPPRSRRIVFIVASIAGAVLVIVLAVQFLGIAPDVAVSTSQVLTVIAFLSAAIVAGVLYFGVKSLFPHIVNVLPALSMFGIVYVTSVTVAAGRDRLLVIGPLLLVAVVTHNSIGYTLGYWLSRAFRLDKNSARTVALEVGLQNGGMATTIAASLNQLATLGLAAAVFNPWMNFSGSMLANHWRRRPVTHCATNDDDQSFASPN